MKKIDIRDIRSEENTGSKPRREHPFSAAGKSFKAYLLCQRTHAV